MISTFPVNSHSYAIAASTTSYVFDTNAGVNPFTLTFLSCVLIIKASEPTTGESAWLSSSKLDDSPPDSIAVTILFLIVLEIISLPARDSEGLGSQLRFWIGGLWILTRFGFVLLDAVVFWGSCADFPWDDTVAMSWVILSLRSLFCVSSSEIPESFFFFWVVRHHHLGLYSFWSPCFSIVGVLLFGLQTDSCIP